MIYLPLIAGTLALAALGVLLARAQLASASTWADAGLVLLLVMALGPALVLLALLSAIGVGLWYLIRWMPLPMQHGRRWSAESTRVTRRAADLAVKPIVTPSAVWAALAAAWRTLLSIFRRAESGDA